MKIHHLNCMSFRRLHVREVTHVLLLETCDGLILVDSGLGLGDFTHPSWDEWLALRLDEVTATPDETPLRQIAALGLEPREVRHIIPTHLHLDHVGGACDFPWATLYAWEVEVRAGLRPTGLLGHAGYFPARWKDHPGLKTHALNNERWFELPAMPVFRGAEVEIWLVPLTGHSPGHCGVAVKTASGWLWHCGDAYVRQGQVNPANPRPAFSPVAGGFEEFMFPAAARQAIIKVLAAHGDEVTAFCSHDTEVYARMAGVIP